MSVAKIIPQLTLADQARFWAKVDCPSPDACWTWLACRNREGYGSFWAQNRDLRAHRVAWTLLRPDEPLVPGLVLDHRVCDNPACVNPAHLVQTDNWTNSRRGGGLVAANAAKTCCPACGGEYYSRPSGGRRCAACRSERDRDYRNRHSDEINARRRATRAANPDEFRAKERVWHAASRERHRDERNARNRAYRAALRERRIEAEAGEIESWPVTAYGDAEGAPA